MSSNSLSESKADDSKIAGVDLTKTIKIDDVDDNNIFDDPNKKI